MPDPYERLRDLIRNCPWIPFPEREKFCSGLAVMDREKVKGFLEDMVSIFKGDLQGYFQNIYDEMLAEEILSNILNETVEGERDGEKESKA